MIEGQTCAMCRFWDPTNPGGAEDIDGSIVGFCRRWPPLMIGAQDPKNWPYRNMARGFWMETDANDWCGEWQPTTDQTAPS